VSGSSKIRSLDKEKEMLIMDHKAKIRHMVLVEGKSQRQVAKETGHSRNTVKKMLQDSEIPRYRSKKPRTAPVLGPYKELLATWVEEDEKKPKKQRRTAARMYELLVAEHGFRGGKSTVRVYVGKLRKRVRTQVYTPLSYAPGETMQVDFGEGEAVIRGQRVKVKMFVAWMAYSGARWMQAYPGETQEVLLEAQAQAFAFFGGVPREVWYDNMKVAVQEILEGRNRREQERFASFHSHYLYEPHFCNPASGWEKGGVENSVGYTRRNWLVGAPEFADWEALNAYLRERSEGDQVRRLRGRTKTIGQRLAEEQAQMRPLPPAPFPWARSVAVTVNKLSLVTFATNRYSVPVSHAHERLTLRATAFEIAISNGQAVIARHLRCWGREQDILEPYHYLPLLAQRPRAFEHAQAIREWRQRWPAVFDRVYERLQQENKPAQATRHFIELLMLGQGLTEARLAAALEEALRHGCLQVACVRELLRRQEDHPAPQPDLSQRPHLAAVAVQRPDIARYDQLLAPAGGVR